MGSVMQIVVEDVRNIRGTYTSVTKDAQGNTTKVEGQLKGFFAGDLISFLVLWQGGSMTAWTGQLTGEGEDNPVLKTLWNLVTEVPNPQDQNFLWLSTLTGADEFTMTTTKKIR